MAWLTIYESEEEQKKSCKRTIRRIRKRIITVNISCDNKVSSGKGPIPDDPLPEDKVAKGYDHILQLDHAYHAMAIRQGLKALPEVLHPALNQMLELHKQAPNVIDSLETEIAHLKKIEEAHDELIKMFREELSEEDQSFYDNVQEMGEIIMLGGELTMATMILNNDYVTTRDWAEDNDWLPPRPHSFDI